MRIVKACTFAAIAMALLAGTSFWMAQAPSAGAAEKQAVVKSHWRHHDGHWNYWDEGDKRWYYTDGSNWYYSDGDAWKVYGFNANFGREGFERGEYKAPAEGVRVVVPTHRVYVPRQ